MSTFFKEFQKHSFLLQYLITRDFKVKYRRSILGIAWSVLNPLFMMIIVSAVFSVVIRVNIGDYSYPVYVILGQTMFTFLSDATNTAMQSILASSSLIKKVYIPKYIFPLEKVTFSFVNFIVSMAAVLIVCIVEGVGISLKLLALPLLFIIFYIFCLGIGLFLSVVCVFFRDMLHIHSIILTAWMYLTPIFYSIDTLTSLNSDAWWKTLLIAVFKYNPMYQYINCFRNLILFKTWPSLFEIGLCVGYAAVVMIVGALLFKKKQDKFILYI